MAKIRTARDFWVDHSDPPYPAIRHKSDPRLTEHDELKTFNAARQEVKEKCREHRQHWLAVMNYQLSQSAEDVIRESLQAGRTE